MSVSDPTAKAGGLCLDSTATLRSARAAQLWLHRPTHQGIPTIGFGSYSLAGIKGSLIGRGSSHGKIALSHIHTNHLLVAFGCRVCSLNFKRDEQIELLAGLVLPEFCSSEMCSLLHEAHVLVIARIGHKHPPVQGQDADQVSLLQAVVPMIVIGGGDVPGWLIQALVAFLGVACFACLSILLDLRPECLVGGAHLAGDIAGHLSRKLMDTAYLIVAIALQGSPTAHLAMRETVVAHIVQGIAVRQLGTSQRGELCRIGMQFQLGGDELFHSTRVLSFTQYVKLVVLVKRTTRPRPQQRNAAFLPTAQAGGLLRRFVEHLNICS